MAKEIRLGDAVAKIAKFVGIQPCEACKRRQEMLNHLFSKREKNKVREMTDEEVSEWEQFQIVRSLRLSNDQRLYVCRIYADVFQVPYFEPCVNCSPTPYIKMIERMDEVVKTYKVISL